MSRIIINIRVAAQIPDVTLDLGTSHRGGEAETIRFRDEGVPEDVGDPLLVERLA